MIKLSDIYLRISVNFFSMMQQHQFEDNRDVVEKTTKTEENVVLHYIVHIQSESMEKKKQS